MRDTRGPVPGATSDLRRVSLNPAHWRQSRWMLAAEALATALLGGVGMVGVFLVAPVGVGFSVAGLVLTPALSCVLLGVGATAAAAMIHRRLALLYSAAMSICAVGLVIISAAAATHHAPGPLGLTAAAIVLWGVLVCYNLALMMWLAPDQIEGPDWVPKRRKARHSNASDEEASDER
ncbi:MAG: hypothetical protein WAO15_21010 [Mycobacterium sp.]